MQIYYFDSPHKQILSDFKADLVRVIDGDTIRVKTDFRDFDFPVRLLKIAAPEMNEDGGSQSKSHLEQLIGSGTIEILVDPKIRVGKWGRILGTIFAQGIDVNDQMMRDGFAVPFEDRKQSKLPDIEETLRFEF